MDKRESISEMVVEFAWAYYEAYKKIHPKSNVKFEDFVIGFNLGLVLGVRER